MRPKGPNGVLLLAAAATGVPGLPAPPALAGAASVGAVGGGDPYFPRQGNGGYQGRHYSLHVWNTPSSHRLSRLATIPARGGPRAVRRFDLDLRRNLHVRSVLVDGHAARFSLRKSLV